MAKIQGSNGLWYEGVVKDGRIWTARGNTGVAPYSPPPKKTLLPYASEADKAYAAAHPDQYNLPSTPGAQAGTQAGVQPPAYAPGSKSGVPPEALGLPSSLVGIQPPKQYVQGSGVPPEVSGSSSSLAPTGRPGIPDRKGGTAAEVAGSEKIPGEVGKGFAEGAPAPSLESLLKLLTDFFSPGPSGQRKPSDALTPSWERRPDKQFQDTVQGGRAGVAAPTPPGPPQPLAAEKAEGAGKGDATGLLGQLAQEILRFGGGGTLLGAAANNLGGVGGAALGGAIQSGAAKGAAARGVIQQAARGQETAIPPFPYPRRNK